MAASGTEENHLILRQRVVTFLRHHGAPEEEMNKMEKSGEWMTDREIDGFAKMLGVKIFSCVETLPGKWCYQEFPHPSETHIPASAAIYIANIPKDTHYQLVIMP